MSISVDEGAVPEHAAQAHQSQEDDGDRRLHWLLPPRHCPRPSRRRQGTYTRHLGLQPLFLFLLVTCSWIRFWPWTLTESTTRLAC